MKNIIRQIFSFILPFTVLVLVPLSLEKDIRIKSIPAFIVGICIMFFGLYFMVMTISAFMIKGKGTLAPWSPTKKLIVDGMYGYVRNPMIMGVLAVLTGESIAIMSINIFSWTIIFFIINHFYFLLLEEPLLLKKFGKEYLEYKKHVKRWILQSTPNMKV